MTTGLTRTWAIAASILVAGVLAGGCGSSGSNQTTTDFEIDLPDPVEVTVPATPAPDPNLPDSETNDLPPEPNSPQEAFEKWCNQHPEACG